MNTTMRTAVIALHSLGALAFVWPFLAAPLLQDTLALEQIAPIAAVILAGAVLFVALGGRYTSHEVAVLGVLAGVNAVLRIPGSFGGASPMFALPIIVGATMGARAGFLLGSTSMLASALITGGIGPWLPFQALAMGWAGGGAGLVVRDRGPIPIAIYGWFVGYVFGALLNLSFWPFQRSGSSLAFQPGASGTENLAGYWRFYLVTSLAWDSMRAIGNAVLLVVLAAPVRVLLKESQSRGRGRWLPSGS
ncbi:MAG: ECF transporter S component [Actinomycetota bacterium]